MKKFVLILFLLMAVFGSAAAQTCDCGDLQAQVDALTMQVQNLTDLFEAFDMETIIQDSTSTQIKSESLEPVNFKDCSVSFHTMMLRSNSRYSILDVYLTFQNTSETETVDFISQVRLRAFQDGIGLLEGRNRGTTRYLRPGQQRDLRKSYILVNPGSSVELEFIPIRSGQDPEIRMIDLSGQ